MREAVIAGAVRTSVGKRKGGLSSVHAADLSAVVLRALVERTGVDPALIDDVVWGCVSQVGDQSSMLTGPIPATEKVLRRTGLTVADIGIFEVNEAFAPVPLAWQAETGADPERLNPLGGAIALGHPLGGSGAVLMTRMIHHMRDHGIRFGLQTMCEGGGTANATVVELVS
jgi:acetyl-CoA acetyltransferase